MKSTFFAFSLAAFSALISCLSPPILQINDEYDSNLKTLISTGGEAYIMFHASWCGACQRFKPYYQAFADRMAEDSPVVQMLAVDNDDSPKLVSRFQIAYLPSLFHIRDGKIRNIGDHRAYLDEYVKNSKWSEIAPISETLAPYSLLGNILAFVGSLGFAILGVLEKVADRSGVPVTILFPILTAIAVFCLLGMFSRLTATPKPEPKTPAQAKKDD